MEKILKSSLFWGLLLILAGGAMLVQNLFGFPLLDLVWGLVLGVFGGFFIYLATKDKEQWWRWLVGAGLIGLSISSILDFVLPKLASYLDGAEFLGSLAVGFLLIYFAQRSNWWAVIPAGVLATLSVVTLLDSTGIGPENSSIFFIGLGITFVIIGLLPNAGQKWGFIPGGFLLVFGLLLALQAGFIFDVIWPVGLILGGGFLIFRAVRPT